MTELLNGVWQASLWLAVGAVLLAVMRPEVPFIMPETRTYLRDCFDHAVAVLDLVESYREMTNGLMEVYLMDSSNRMAEVMKIATAIKISTG